MPWNNNKIKVTRKVMHVDCGDCKRYRKDCKASYNYYVWNRDDNCMLCVPKSNKKPPRKYDKVNMNTTEEKRNIAIMAMKPSVRQGNGHR